MEGIKSDEKVEWTTQTLYADGEIEFVELCFHIPAELWTKFKSSELYKELIREFSHLEKWEKVDIEQEVFFKEKYEEITTGKSTINEIRKENGLEPLMVENAYKIYSSQRVGMRDAHVDK